MSDVKTIRNNPVVENVLVCIECDEIVVSQEEGAACGKGHALTTTGWFSESAGTTKEINEL